MHSNSTTGAPWEATAVDLAERLAAGETTSAALVRACQDQIAAHDLAGAGLGALRVACTEAAADAGQLDAERRAGAVRGPLHGIPLLLKDNIDLRGYPTTSGCRALARAAPRRDAEVTRRLREAGAVLLGKTNLSEFSFEIRSRSSLGGEVRNPFDRRVTAGGSSGGSAAAVAAGFAVAALGTDTGGSIRVPAAFNGLVGLRPTHGLLDLRGVAPLAPSTDTVGPIARCVRDAALLFGVLAGGSVGANLAARREPRELPERRGLAGARLGLLRQAWGDEPPIRAALEAALTLLREAGAVPVDPVSLADDVLPIDRALVVDWEFRPAFDAYLRDNFEPGSAPQSLSEIQSSGEYLPAYRDALAKRITM